MANFYLHVENADFHGEISIPEDIREKLVNATVYWLLRQIRNHQDMIDESMDLPSFSDELYCFLEERVKHLNCANIRTTSPNSKLVKLAEKYNIPFEVLPSKCSIIINSSAAFYISTGGQHLYIKEA